MYHVVCDQVFICRRGSVTDTRCGSVTDTRGSVTDTRCGSVTDTRCLTLSQPPKSGRAKEVDVDDRAVKKTDKPFCALISDHDKAGGRTVHAARYGLCRTCAFLAVATR